MVCEFYELFARLLAIEPAAIFSHKKMVDATVWARKGSPCIWTAKPVRLQAAAFSGWIRMLLSQLRTLWKDPKQQAVTLAKAKPRTW
eukprot:3013177-Alexandrium_andersonii.AAC.1